MTFHREMFSEHLLGAGVDAVVCRHTLEHIGQVVSGAELAQEGEELALAAAHLEHRPVTQPVTLDPPLGQVARERAEPRGEPLRLLVGARVGREGGVKREVRRSTVAKIEKFQRAVDVEEVLLLALALGVSPLHLVVPRREDWPLGVGEAEIPAAEAGAWWRGEEPLPGMDESAFRAAGATNEWDRPRQDRDLQAAVRELEGRVRRLEQGTDQRGQG